MTVWLAGDFAAGAHYENRFVPWWNVAIAFGTHLVLIALLAHLLETQRKMEGRIRRRPQATAVTCAAWTPRPVIPMRLTHFPATLGLAALLAGGVAINCSAENLSSPAPPQALTEDGAQSQNWNWHVQNTDIAQATPGFAAKYSGPNSLDDRGEIRETMPEVSNGMAQDAHFLKAWGSVAELERRFTIAGHPGAVRLLLFRNRAHMGSYAATLDNPAAGMDITQTRAYRYKNGCGINAEQEFAGNVGAFARLGWSDGRNESWCFADVDRTATLGLSFKGAAWNRPGDTLGVACVLNAISSVHRRFLAAGGAGILAGDGALSYGAEQIAETYYDVRLSPHLNAALDYQFVANPAYNRDRGPVSVFAIRLHWSL